MRSSQELDPQEFGIIARIIREESGIDLDPGKLRMVQARLSKRLRQLKTPTFAEYVEYLGRDHSGSELQVLVSLMTTNVTSFFRETHHFDTLRDAVLPELLKSKGETGQIRIWSAGCSFGHEPYSIAMICDEFLQNHPLIDLKILASDIDRGAINGAQSGIFDTAETTMIPDRYTKCLLPTSNAGKVKISERVQRHISFRILNLMSEWPFSRSFDVIFCRNVMIYFEEPTKQRLLKRFDEILAPESWLFIGHSERVYGPARNLFRPLGNTAYRKTLS